MHEETRYFPTERERKTTRAVLAPKSICFIVNTLTHGGGEIQVVRLATRLAKRGWRVNVVTLVDGGEFVDELSSAGVGVWCLRMSRGIPDPRAVIRLRRMLAALSPTIVHSHIAHANILARVARVVAHVPVLVSTAHSLKEGGRLIELAYRLTDSLADLTTNVSHAAVERYVRIGAVKAARVKLMHNGLDTEEFRRSGNARAEVREQLELVGLFVWLAVGRLVDAKDYSTMLRGFAEVARASSTAILLIAGVGPEEAALRRLAKSLNITRNVRFLGLRRDIARLMSAADGYVMSSVREGMPLVLQEASASGLPVVATRVGGNTEVVADTVSGLIVPPRAPDLIASSMLQIMALPAPEREAMGAAGRERVRAHFEMDSVVDRWERLYEELLARKGRHLCT